MGGRKQSFKEPKSGIYIIGEGITEKFYFQHLRSIFKYQYTIKPRFFDLKCINKFDKIIESLLRGDITIICVYDEDVSRRNKAENEKLSSLHAKYSSNENVIFCGSYPSIEYWFLLHYKDTCPEFNTSDEALKKLLPYIKNYEKTKRFLKNTKWVKEMSVDKGSIVEAKGRAKKYRTRNSKSWIYLAIEMAEKTIR